MNTIFACLMHLKAKVPAVATLALLLASANLHAATYWVAPNGDDSGACNELSPCASVQAGVKKLSAGDVLNIKAGIYYETNTEGVEFFENPVAISMDRSGTPDNPIVIQAAPGDEGQAIIDLQATYVGFYFYGHQDYIHIKNLVIRNARSAAINVPDSGIETSYNEPSKWSFGLLFEGNKILDTYGTGAGNNSSAIRIFHVRDSIMRNNEIDRVGTDGLTDLKSHNSCVISYGLWNVIVENNLFKRCGAGAVYWKSQAKDIPQTGYQSTIRYNHFIDNHIAVSDGDRRGNGVHRILISNNIFENYYIGVQFQETRVNATVAHNFFNGEGSRQPGSIAIIARDDLNSFSSSIYGNVYHSNETHVYDFRPSDSNITQVNHNIFTSQPSAVLYAYQPNSFVARNLPDWQSITGDATLPNNPDADSVISSLSAVAQNLAHGDYTLPPGSIAAGFLPNGDNAGPYQKGNEEIGITSCVGCTSQTAAPLSPQAFSATLQP